jgi:hypothetical protein
MRTIMRLKENRMPVTKMNRALLVVSNLTTRGRTDLQWLYQFLDGAGVELAEQLMGPQYGTVEKLAGAQVTKQGFLTAVSALGSKQAVRAIDVIVNLHGANQELFFEDGGVSTASLKHDLLALNLGHKLRLLYSTACYGRSHAGAFVASGFTAASGAVGVNANSATEYPIVLTMWAAGAKFRDALAVGENVLTREPADEIAKLMGFPDADSDKVIHGNGAITINADP